jgi:hypothetical protein
MTNIGSSWDLRESLFPPPSHNCFGAVLIQRTLTFCLSWDYSRRSFSSCKWIFELPNCQVKNKIHKLRIIKGQIAAIIRFHSFLLFVYWTGVFTQHSCCSPALFLGNHAKFVWAVVVQSSGPKYPILTSMGPWQLMLCAAPARPGLPTRHDATLMAWCCNCLKRAPPPPQAQGKQADATTRHRVAWITWVLWSSPGQCKR